MGGLIEKIHDQPFAGENPRGLIICATPRSGCHQLGELLHAAGAGVPTEYFHPAGVETLSRRWGLPPHGSASSAEETYFDALLSMRTANCIFASIAFPQHIPQLLRLLPRLRDVFFIHLKRADTAAQIISLITLYQTKAPYDDVETFDSIPDVGVVSAKLIATLDRYIKHQNRQWTNFLQRRHHLEMWSEDLFDNPLAQISKALHAAEIRSGPEEIARAVETTHRKKNFAIYGDMKSKLRTEFAEALRSVVPMRG